MFEDALPQTRVSAYAKTFLSRLLGQAPRRFDDRDARRMAAWVRHLDLYGAVKTVEGLLNDRAALAVLELAQGRGWRVHLDHLAIRCGSSRDRAAEALVRMLKDHHGYGSTRLPEEAHYRFEDGWDAFPLYKILENGQVLRLFIDQSDTAHPEQIIQHWNRVYGFTAHHMALRVTRVVDGSVEAVPLSEIMRGVGGRGIGTLTPTGLHTRGLLEQVFTEPTRNPWIPARLKREIAHHGPGLAQAIENAKLIELVSRREMPLAFARRLYALYGLELIPDNPLHSAPIYTYFLPAQAAHVIRTSTAHGPCRGNG